MKTLFILAVILSTALAKQVETKAEKFECIAKNLRDKKLLDNDFKFSENSQHLECDAVIAELKQKILTDDLNLTLLREESENSKALKKLVQDNLVCIKDELIASGYSETKMKISIYEVSRNLQMKQRKQLTASTKAEGDKKMQISILKCVTGPIFGKLFDDLMKGEDEQELEGKQINYCIRKYVVDKNLIDTNELTVNLNPDNIEISIDCEQGMKTAIVTLEEAIKETYKGLYNLEIQIQCLINVIMTGKGLDYTAKAFVLSEANLSDDKKNQYRSEFVDNFRALSDEMAKCV
ncbi:uncharacterized protein [Chironomus tepperi]|uniref:uncharacterized protein n=1 Tax=Chironomus tepperi TaxID=113505 RepID=UPI00391EF1D5